MLTPSASRAVNAVVIAANSDSAYRVAESLRGAGMNVTAIDRPSATRAEIGGDATRRVTGLKVFEGAAIVKVVGSSQVSSCTVSPWIAAGARPDELQCDLILSAGGHAPTVHLHSQAGGKLRWVEESAMFVPDGPAPGLWSAGACAGVFTRDAA